MELRFIGQPFENQLNLTDFVHHVSEARFRELFIGVAWAKQSGLSRIWDQLSDFRESGGRITLILGVSEGGATKEGLELAASIAHRAYVFHDPRRTFHPKVYFATSSSNHSLFLGSSNLTAGGIGWNYETSLWIDWRDDELRDLAPAVSGWFQELLESEDSCKPLTNELIHDLLASSDIFITSEKDARRSQRKGTSTPEDSDSVIATTVHGLFKPVIEGLRQLPPPSSKLVSPTLVNSTRAKIQQPEQSIQVQPSMQQSPSLNRDDVLSFDSHVRRRWIKELDATAAQRVKSARSNPTGNLRLSRAQAQIDHKTYFREVFFADLPWTTREDRPTEQEVMVNFRTLFDGEDIGVIELRISHDQGRIANQGNVPTLLHWGVLGKRLRAGDYIGFSVTLEQTYEGGYNLIISRTPNGDYLS